MEVQTLLYALDVSEKLLAKLQKEFSALDSEVRKQERAFVAHAEIKETQQQRKVKKGKESVLKNLQDQLKQSQHTSGRKVAEMKDKLEEMKTTYQRDVKAVHARFAERRRQLDEEERRALQGLQDDFSDRTSKTEAKIESEEAKLKDKIETYYNPQINAQYEEEAAPVNEVVPAYTRSFLKQREERDNLASQVKVAKKEIEEIQSKIVEITSGTSLTHNRQDRAVEAIMKAEKMAREKKNALLREQQRREAENARLAMEAEEIAAKTARESEIKREAEENKRRNLTRGIAELEAGRDHIQGILDTGVIPPLDEGDEELPLDAKARRDYEKSLQKIVEEIASKKKYFEETFEEELPRTAPKPSLPPPKPSSPPPKRVLKIKKKTN